MKHQKYDLEFQLLTLTLTLYNNPLIPRKVVQFFIDTLIYFIYEIFFPIIIQQLQLVSKDKNVIADINRIMKASKEIFEKFRTEHQRLELYEEKGLITEPEDFEIKDGDFAYYIPLKWSLQKFLQIPGPFKLLKETM